MILALMLQCVGLAGLYTEASSLRRQIWSKELELEHGAKIGARS